MSRTNNDSPSSAGPSGDPESAPAPSRPARQPRNLRAQTDPQASFGAPISGTVSTIGGSDENHAHLTIQQQVSTAGRRKPAALRRARANLAADITAADKWLKWYRDTVIDPDTREFSPLLSHQVTVRLVKLPEWCVKATGDHTLALILGQLLYFLDGRRRNRRRRAHRPQPHSGLPHHWMATTSSAAKANGM